MFIRDRFYLVSMLLLLVLGAVVFIFLNREQEPAQTYTATVNRDCAPWDGAAFTVSVPIEKGVIKISIFQSPKFSLPVTFSFPDETLQEGNALLLQPVGVPEPLEGSVSFQRVEEGKDVEGRFDLDTAAGQRFNGKFLAQWGNELVYCG